VGEGGVEGGGWGEGVREEKVGGWEGGRGEGVGRKVRGG